MRSMKGLAGAVLAVALAGCPSEHAGEPDASLLAAGFRPMNVPYVGYPGPVGPLDAGAAETRGDAGAGHAGRPGGLTAAGGADAGVAILAPPSTAMVAPRPFYPLAGGAARPALPDAGAPPPARPRVQVPARR